MDPTSMNPEEVHLSEAQWMRLRRGQLPPDEVVAVTAHLAACEACRERGRGHLAPQARSVVDALTLDSRDEHPDTDTTLADFVDGRLPFDERERVEAHLGICDRCRQDVDELTAAAASMQRPPTARREWWLAVAAALGLVAATVLLLPRRESPPEDIPTTTSVIVRPAPTPNQPPLKPQWQALVQRTLRDGRIAVPRELREIQVSPETVRGTSEAHPGVVSPAQEVVESDRPTFTWPAQKGATAVVFVYRDEEEVAVSEPVQGNTWTPSKPLPRGVALVWQVELSGADGSMQLVPSPPDPPAIFRVLDERSRREIEEAARLQPRNDLLLGILYARAGVKDRAIEALGRHAAAQPETKSLLESVQDWP